MIRSKSHDAIRSNVGAAPSFRMEKKFLFQAETKPGTDLRRGFVIAATLTTTFCAKQLRLSTF